MSRVKRFLRKVPLIKNLKHVKKPKKYVLGELLKNVYLRGSESAEKEINREIKPKKGPKGFHVYDFKGVAKPPKDRKYRKFWEKDKHYAPNRFLKMPFDYGNEHLIIIDKKKIKSTGIKIEKDPFHHGAKKIVTDNLKTPIQISEVGKHISLTKTEINKIQRNPITKEELKITTGGRAINRHEKPIIIDATIKLRKERLLTRKLRRYLEKTYK